MSDHHPARATVAPVLHQEESLAARHTGQDGVHLVLEIDANLEDLQRKFPQIMGTIPLPRDNCRSFTLVNPVVDLSKRQLRAEDGRAVVELGGEVDGWTCVENPVPETYWDPTGCRGDLPFGGHYVFGCPKTRAAGPIKNKTLTQPFDASIPASRRSSGSRWLVRQSFNLKEPISLSGQNQTYRGKRFPVLVR